MWRSLKQAAVKSKFHNKRIHRQYSNESSSSKSGKVALIIAATGAGLTTAAVYSKYDPKLKSIFEKNIPYIDELYKLLPDASESKSSSSKTLSDDKKESAMAPSLLKKKLEREKAAIESQKSGKESKSRESSPIKGSVNENLLNDIKKKLESSYDETISAYEDAVKAIRRHTKSLYEALDLPEGSDSDIVWKEANLASTDKNNAIKEAQDKASSTKTLAEKLIINARKAALKDPNHPLVKICEDTVEKIAKELNISEAQIKSVENEAKTATEYQKLVSKSKEEFQRELEIVLPNYTHGASDKTITESDLNLLIAHAHRRIEQLQKQLARQQVTEKNRIDEALRHQKFKEDNVTEAKIEAELEKRNIDLESAVTQRVASLKENFEYELRKQLHRQAAAHTDHIQEVLKVQEQELERKFSLDLEEKLLHQKGIFISEVSGSMARLKGILAFLKAKTEFDIESKKAQSLWLACQSMSEKISSEAGNLSPLGKDVAAIKLSADESNVYVNTVLAGIPSEAVTRGVFSPEVLKQRFLHVKKVCRKVAMIDENNDSLYRYLLSYLQSYLIIDEASIPKAELEGKVAVDPSEWDTYDILSRVSYSLRTDNLEQALRYANQLKGEPRIVAKDWMKELRLLLETQVAVKALLAHAAAVGVQAYH
ncbi:MICOS complex subunit Mic60 isoform X2 [Parasteatoda tepidariorum]|uniref:MICOS complex subunit Mic60 isoform X2 n=1 Tax=Parasteatoda tepidariorum TaxID=114398 RepID=UPI00077FBDD0|nr:MICOS complex subunit Mic60 isoform X2 [Parasteatoda tepidariorum]